MHASSTEQPLAYQRLSDDVMRTDCYGSGPRDVQVCPALRPQPLSFPPEQTTAQREGHTCGTTAAIRTESSLFALTVLKRTLEEERAFVKAKYVIPLTGYISFSNA